ncbi:hypothetical protein OIU85_005412 [Salix viminalis]|uniref:DUF4283 domain-containing protein n=1 Tax=Salix viminalis TaxID=40686 RepID=A0A9Q0PIY4_SALVM|nr:hypothetical protein OIU85_005412 [Salix viminalis]
MLKVLGDSSHSIKGKPLMVQSMPLYFDFSPPILVYALVWVRLPNLLLECWTPECMSKICSVLGHDSATCQNHAGFEVTPPMNIGDAIPLNGFVVAEPLVTLSPINIGLVGGYTKSSS